jgi:4-amino-4-deoxy-L-arabinose transferase-like glycosyltransferase
MARESLPYINQTLSGQGIEGLVDYANRLTDNFMISIFLLLFYGLSIYVFSKSEWKLGGLVAFTSFFFFILSMIAQIFTTINQIVIFIFFIGIIVGIVMTFIENAKT